MSIYYIPELFSVLSFTLVLLILTKSFEIAATFYVDLTEKNRGPEKLSNFAQRS